MEMKHERKKQKEQNLKVTYPVGREIADKLTVVEKMKQEGRCWQNKVHKMAGDKGGGGGGRRSLDETEVGLGLNASSARAS